MTLFSDVPVNVLYYVITSYLGLHKQEKKSFPLSGTHSAVVSVLQEKKNHLSVRSRNLPQWGYFFFWPH